MLRRSTIAFLRRAAVACCLMLAAASGPARAVQPDEVLRDSALETRARTLSRELRCMVCQNQSIDDSDAPLARDLRLIVRERLTSGDSDAQVLDFLVARYGEFVLLKPRVEWRTALLWLAPVVVFFCGLMAVVLSAKRRRQARNDTPQALTAAEQARLAALERRAAE